MTKTDHFVLALSVVIGLCVTFVIFSIKLDTTTKAVITFLLSSLGVGSVVFSIYDQCIKKGRD